MYDMFLALLESDRLTTILDFVVKIITIISGVVLAYLTLLQLKVRNQSVTNGTQLDEINSTTKATSLAVNGHKQELERQIAVLHEGYSEAGLKAPEDATPRPPVSHG